MDPQPAGAQAPLAAERPPDGPGAAAGRGLLRWHLLAVFALALALRLLVLHQLQGSPFLQHPIIDASMYDAAAWQLVSGAPSEDVYYQAPLYSHFLAGIYALFGHQLTAAYLAQAVLGALACVLLLLIGRRLLGPREALAAGLLAAAYGPALFYDVQLLRTTLITCLTLGVVLLAVSLEAGSRLSRFALLGALLGLTASAQESILLFVPLVLLWVARCFRGRRPLHKALTLLGGVVLVLAPLTLRNVLVSGDLCLVSYQGGLNLYLGNHPDHDRLTTLQPGHEWEQVFNLPARQGLQRRSEQSSWFVRQTLRVVASDPLGWLRRLGKKGLLLVSGEELEPNQSLAHYRQRSALLRWLILDGPLFLPLGVVLPLALLGLLGVDLRDRRWAFVAWLLLVLAASVILTHVRARYRVPLCPLLLLLAVRGAGVLGRGLRASRRRLLVGAGVLALGALLASGVLVDTRYARRFPLDRFLGWAHEQAGALEPAAAAYRRALAAAPDDVESLAALGGVLVAQRRPQEAIPLLLRARGLAPSYKPVLGTLGNAYAGSGEPARALAAYAEASRIDPADDWLHGALAFLAPRVPLAQAAPALEAAASRAPAAAAARLRSRLAALWLQAGEPRQAVALARAALAGAPGDPAARRALALGLESLGACDEAPRACDEALRLAPGDPQLAAARARLRLRCAR